MGILEFTSDESYDSMTEGNRNRFLTVAFESRSVNLGTYKKKVRKVRNAALPMRKSKFKENSAIC